MNNGMRKAYKKTNWEVHQYQLGIEDGDSEFVCFKTYKYPINNSKRLKQFGETKVPQETKVRSVWFVVSSIIWEMSYKW